MSRIERLPKWAQAHIAGLERQVKDLKAYIDEIAGYHEPTNVRVASYSDNPDFALAPGSMIDFYMNGTTQKYDDTITVRHSHHNRKHLEIRGSSHGYGLLIMAHAPNSLRLWNEGP